MTITAYKNHPVPAEFPDGSYAGHKGPNTALNPYSEYVGSRNLADFNWQVYDWTLIPDPDWVASPEVPVQPIIETGWIDDMAKLDAYKEQAYGLVNDEMLTRIDTAQDTPAIGKDYTNNPNMKAKANHKRSAKANKKVNGISDADDHLYDHIDLVHDFAETQDDTIEAAFNYATVDAVTAGLDSAGWPTWTPIA